VTAGSPGVDATHDPTLASWVESAHAQDADFPIQNLPLGVFLRSGDERPRVGIAIGDEILDCLAAARAGWFDRLDPALRDALQSRSLNWLMALGRGKARELRAEASRLLRADTPEGSRARAARAEILVAARDVAMLLPAEVGDYTDFYASLDHARRIGAMFRPDSPLMPNYHWVPIAYHGRASSIVVSGTPVRRPNGQSRPDPTAPPVFGPTRSLDYEVELGIWLGGSNAVGEPVPIARAAERLFGLTLLNDWSARDVQTWEYQPLGPFLAKNFATTVSPWVVTVDALAPFRAPAAERDPGDPQPLAYLDDPADRAHGAFDVTLEVLLTTPRIRAEGLPPVRLSRAYARNAYWTPAQMVAHHSSNGCNLRAGDLFGSGTVSGPGAEERGCLLELTARGTEPLRLSTGETRTYLADGDEVVFRGWCERAGAVRIGFGECRGVVLPALED
jgi:fumarylacetoacetase